MRNNICCIFHDFVTYPYFVASKTQNAKDKVECAEFEAVFVWTFRNNCEGGTSKIFGTHSLTSCLPCRLVNKIWHDACSWFEIPTCIEIYYIAPMYKSTDNKTYANGRNSDTVTDLTCFSKHAWNTPQCLTSHWQECQFNIFYVPRAHTDKIHWNIFSFRNLATFRNCHTDGCS
jgi:hypothetical protein